MHKNKRSKLGPLGLRQRTFIFVHTADSLNAWEGGDNIYEIESKFF